MNIKKIDSFTLILNNKVNIRFGCSYCIILIFKHAIIKKKKKPEKRIIKKHLILI